VQKESIFVPTDFDLLALACCVDFCFANVILQNYTKLFCRNAEFSGTIVSKATKVIDFN
jgi:hypothetical protein